MVNMLTDSSSPRTLHCNAQIFSLPGLSSREKLVYLVLKSYSKEQGSVVFPKNKTIARDASCSERQVIRITNRLVECGLLRKIERFNSKTGARIRNDYDLRPVSEYIPFKDDGDAETEEAELNAENTKYDTVACTSEKSGDSAHDTVSQNKKVPLCHGAHVMASQQEQVYLNNKKHIPPIAPKGGEGEEAVSETQDTEQAKPEAETEDFDLASSPSKAEKKKSKSRARLSDNPNPLDEWFEQQFWPNYPRHVDKKRARNTFMRVLAKARSPEEQKDWVRNMGVRLARYIHDVEGREEQYIKHPSTWLNAHDFSEPPEENEILRQEVFVRDGREAG